MTDDAALIQEATALEPLTASQVAELRDNLYANFVEPINLYAEGINEGIRIALAMLDACGPGRDEVEAWCEETTFGPQQ